MAFRCATPTGGSRTATIPSFGPGGAAQNAVTRSAYLDALPGRPAIAERMRQALDVGLVGTAVPRGRYLFLTRRDAGMDQIVLMVSDAGEPTLSLCWAVLDLFIACARGLALTALERRQLAQMRAARQAQTPDSLTA